jgi:hypothetical protein
MGFGGSVSGDRQRELIEKALRRGGVRYNRTNIEIKFKGDAHPLITFEGPAWVAAGMLEFYHYDTRVLSVDFTRDRITDFGYTGHSMTTNRYLSAWKRALGDMFFQAVECLRSETNVFRWTATTNTYFERGKGHASQMFARFRAKAPWVKQINGTPWFCARQYDHALEDHFDKLRREILSDGVSWHWFTADWNAHGQWGKCFIDDAAKKRWEKREAKLLREAARHRAAYDASVEAAAT